MAPVLSYERLRTRSQTALRNTGPPAETPPHVHSPFSGGVSPTFVLRCFICPPPPQPASPAVSHFAQFVAFSGRAAQTSPAPSTWQGCRNAAPPSPSRRRRKPRAKTQPTPGRPNGFIPGREWGGDGGTGSGARLCRSSRAGTGEGHGRSLSAPANSVPTSSAPTNGEQGAPRGGSCSS